MDFNPKLNQGAVINNHGLCDLFKCSPQGGMRRSRQTNTLVIISNHVKSIYEDRWIGDEFHYTGMGMKGDQSLEFAQNKTLAGLPNNGVNAHLFEVFKDKEYTYIGKVTLAKKPYQEEQPGQEGHQRSVWIFPLKVTNKTILRVPEEIIRDNYEQKSKKAKRLSNSKLKSLAVSSPSKSGRRIVESNQYNRNVWVAEYAKRRANGICQLCNTRAPFKNKSGVLFLETHHISWLSKGGDDSIENTVALCPNCHRKMHILNNTLDKKKLISQAKGDIA